MVKQLCVLYFATFDHHGRGDAIWLKGVMQHLFKAQMADIMEFDLRLLCCFIYCIRLVSCFL